MSAAVEAVKENLSSFGKHPYRAVNDGAATSALARSLGINAIDARQLCRAAVERHLDGQVSRRTHIGGLRGGLPPRRTALEAWWVNRAKL